MSIARLQAASSSRCAAIAVPTRRGRFRRGTSAATLARAAAASIAVPSSCSGPETPPSTGNGAAAAVGENAPSARRCGIGRRSARSGRAGVARCRRCTRFRGTRRGAGCSSAAGFGVGSDGGGTGAGAGGAGARLTCWTRGAGIGRGRGSGGRLTAWAGRVCGSGGGSGFGSVATGVVAVGSVGTVSVGPAVPPAACAARNPNSAEDATAAVTASLCSLDRGDLIGLFYPRDRTAARRPALHARTQP